MLKSNILWIGNHQRAEFSRIAESLSRESTISFSADGRDVSDSLRPGVVIIAHNRPNEFGGVQLDSLRGRWSQIRFVNLLGESCCGWKRTSKEIGEAASIYTHEVPGNARVEEIVDLAHGRTSVLGYGASQLAVVYSSRGSFREGLADAIRLTSVKTVESSLDAPVSVQGADFVVWDAADDVELRSHDAVILRRRHPDARIVALLTYPREYEVAMLATRGISVLAQPFALNSLFSYFRQHADVAVTSAA